MHQKNQKRILTGDRPTGKLHIGHLKGSLQNRVKLQNEYEQFILIANIQALTDNFLNPQKVRDSVLELLCDYYAVGIDFEVSKIFIQSETPVVNELFIYISNFISIQKLQHNPTLKTEIQQKNDFDKSTPLGFFIYPAHQIADILMVNADLVPVGKDQAPMIEDTRELVRRFNKTYNVNFLKEPKALFGVTQNVPGIDGNAKMGKSLNNAIFLADSKEELWNKVKLIKTDPNRIKKTDPGRVENNVVFIYHDLFNDNIEEVQDLKERYQKGTVSDIEVKEKLFIAINKILEPIREKRMEAEKIKYELLDNVIQTSKKVNEIGKEIVEKIKETMKTKF